MPRKFETAVPIRTSPVRFWSAGWLLCGALLVTLVTIGCQGRDNRTLAGQVLVNGRPLEDGSIVFVPITPGQGKELTAPVENGQFRLVAPANTLSGRYKVKIFDNSVRNFPWDDPQRYMQAVDSGTLPRQPIPVHYNEQSQLEVELPGAGQPLVFQLDIPETLQPAGR
ncbi:MAG: hypothetical protein KatS3mg109_1799 [Pirellulaceae bacterium]|nr:MAG: hypothetical protein KatS3mg109_1799 [Pirellulaceae bacterium]